jgi:tight adherence protein C
LQEISDGLINVLDLWVLCLGSGMSFHSALVRVTDEKELTNPALREQLLLTNQEILAGASREDALRHLVRRCGNLPDLRSLVAHIIHAERMGSSLAQTLKIFAEGLRFKRSQDAKERIQKLPVKLTLPLVFCIFPTLLIVVIGPTWLQLIRAMFAE